MIKDVIFLISAHSGVISENIKKKFLYQVNAVIFFAVTTDNSFFNQMFLFGKSNYANQTYMLVMILMSLINLIWQEHYNANQMHTVYISNALHKAYKSDMSWT